MVWLTDGSDFRPQSMPLRELQKLRNSQEFRRVYEHGQRFHTPYFSAFILRTDSGEKRIGITVTRKIGKAVVRNRCKRRLREVMLKYYRTAIASVLSSPGYDLVINAKSELVEADFLRIEESFACVIRKFHESLLKQNGEA
jgi:ribonuclease P protein component